MISGSILGRPISPETESPYCAMLGKLLDNKKYTVQKLLELIVSTGGSEPGFLAPDEHSLLS